MICRRRCRRQRCIVALPRNGKKERRDSACLPDVVFSDDDIQFGTVVACPLKFENVVLYVLYVGDDDALLVRPYPLLLMFF